MTPGEDLQIDRAMDSGIFDSCARLMEASDPWITLGMNYDLCRVAFNGPCKEIYAAKYQNRLAGFAILQVCGTFKGYIQTLFVEQELRGRGIGKEMLRFCERRIFTFSPNVFICVSSFNTGAARLYYETGFKLVGELPNFIKEGMTELLLRKSIGPLLGYSVSRGNNGE